MSCDVKCVFSGKVTVLEEDGGRRQAELEVSQWFQRRPKHRGGQECRKGGFRQSLSCSARERTENFYFSQKDLFFLFVF